MLRVKNQERTARVKLQRAELAERIERVRLERAEATLRRLQDLQRKEQEREERERIEQERIAQAPSPQDEILDTFRLGLTVEGLEAELYKAMGITKGSAAAAHNLKQ